VLELDRVLEDSPEDFAKYRHGLRQARQLRRELVSVRTENLLTRMDLAVVAANKKMFWHRAKSSVVVASGNQLAAGVHHFHRVLEIKSTPRSWQEKQLGPAARIGSQTIQNTRDAAPGVAKAFAVIISVVGTAKALQALGETSER